MISYNKIATPEGSFKLSPSGLSLFRRNPKEWLVNMKGGSTFKGNLSSVKGTCIHYVFESAFDNRTEARYYEDVREYLDKEQASLVISDEDRDVIDRELPSYYSACNRWLETEDSSTVIASEPTVSAVIGTKIETLNDYYIAGSIDAIVDHNGKVCIRDYKSTGRKISNIDAYLPQLLTYAIAYEAQHNVPVDYVEVVNISKTKTKGVQFNVIRHKITNEDIKSITTFYDEIIKTHQTALKYPQLEDMLFRDGVNFMGGFTL